MSLIIFVISVFYFDQSNFACTNVCAELFYVYENQCLQTLNLLIEPCKIQKFPQNFLIFQNRYFICHPISRILRWHSPKASTVSTVHHTWNFTMIQQQYHKPFLFRHCPSPTRHLWLGIFLTNTNKNFFFCVLVTWKHKQLLRNFVT